MASSVLSARRKLVPLGAGVLGLVLPLVVCLHGNAGETAKFGPGASGSREALWQSGLALADLASPSDDRAAGIDQGVPAAQTIAATNRLQTNGASDKLDLTETLSPGFQSKTNLQAERSQFQDALDDLRRQLEAGAAHNAQTLATGLSLIEPALIRHRYEGMDMARRLNQTTYLAVGALVAIMLAGIFAAVFILLRGMNRFVEVLAAARQPGALGMEGAVVALNRGDLPPMVSGSVEQATTRFLGAIDRLEHRIQELEQTARHPPDEANRPSAKPAAAERQIADGSGAVHLSPAAVPRRARPAGVLTSHSSILVGKGATLLHLGEADHALQCFEEALALDPNDTDALVNKGVALEQMQRFEDALESYNRALALDGSITAAYLRKGGVCNELQRHSEALECYEKALQTERNSHEG